MQRAKDVFWAHGYQDASISALTEAMGIGSPSLYAAFGSKAGPFCEAAELYRAVDAPKPLQAFDGEAAAGAPPGRTSPIGLATYFDAVVQGLAVRAAERASTVSLRRTADLAMRGWPED